MAINGSKKGKRGERELTKWFENWTGYKFARVPSSGGLRWQRINDTIGDITCTDKKHSLKFPFSIENKKYKELNILPSLIGNKSDILKFWEQAKSDGVRGEKEPLLFMRYNGMKKDTYFVVMGETLGKFIIDFLNHDLKFPMLKFTSKDDKFYIMSSDDVIVVEYKEIYKFVRKKLKK